MHPSRPVLAAYAAAVLFATSGASLATDFIRGDSNSDGKVTISDVTRTVSWLFLGGAEPDCVGSADADDSGASPNITDSVVTLKTLFLGSPSMPAPFPAPGPDPTPTGLDCKSYGNGLPPLEDSATILRIASAVAPGGSRRDATIALALTTQRQGISAYSGIIRGPGGLFEDGPDGSNWDGGDANHEDLAKAFSGGWQAARVLGEKVQFSMVLSLTEAKAIPIGDTVPISRIRFCLEPGTPAGEYPLVLEDVELSGCINDMPCGRAIHPAVEGGVLVVARDIEPGAVCDPHSKVPDLPPINVRFSLEERSGTPGGDVSVPFAIRTDRASQGFSYSIHFDENVLQATDTDKIFQTAGGTPYAFERFEENNDTGFVVGAAVISLTDTGAVLPPGNDVTVLEFDFHIDEAAAAGSTELEFLDGGQGTGGPVTNKLIASGTDITPALASSFVFVDGRINIVPDGTPFVRGDSNADRGINIADAVFSLNHLYLGGEVPACPDAADSNDDGKVDISDPVATLNYLFRGSFIIPPPFGAPGGDPTSDDLGCRES